MTPPKFAVHAALGSDRVQLVTEDDAGVGIVRMLEYTTDVRFQLSDLHVQQLRVEALTEKKFSKYEVATTLASRVLPVPGGP